MSVSENAGVIPSIPSIPVDPDGAGPIETIVVVFLPFLPQNPFPFGSDTGLQTLPLPILFSYVASASPDLRGLSLASL
jgi:hypothetical protein